MMRARSAWSASGEIRMSTGLPITCTPMNTITDIASTTNSAWISRRISQVVIQVSRAPELAYIMPGRGDAIGWPPPAIRINCRRMDASATAPRLSTVDLLARLVSFDTTSRNSNLALIGVRARLPGRAWNSVSYQHRCVR